MPIVKIGVRDLCALNNRAFRGDLYMISAENIKNKTFSRAGASGYKKIEVDAFLDEIVNTLNYLTATQAASEKKIVDYELKINEYRDDEKAIKSALVNAQRISEQLKTDAQKTADDLIFKAERQAQEKLDDATSKSRLMIDEATAEAERILSDAHKKAQEITEQTEQKSQQRIADSERTATEMRTAAEKAVDEQQAVYDRLRLKISALRTNMLDKLNDEINLISSIPDEAAADPKLAARMAVENTAAADTADANAAEKTVDDIKPQNEIERIINQMDMQSDFGAPDESKYTDTASVPAYKTPEKQSAATAQAPIEHAASADTAVHRSINRTRGIRNEAPVTAEKKKSGFTVNFDIDDDAVNNDEPAQQSSMSVADVNNKNSTSENSGGHSRFVFNGAVSDIEEQI